MSEYKTVERGLFQHRHQNQYVTTQAEKQQAIKKEISMFKNRFVVSIVGELRRVYTSHKWIHASYSLACGENWKLLSGIESAQSQTALTRPTEEGKVSTLSIPINASFVHDAKGPMGWPSILIELYGPDFLGRDMCFGYGAYRIPLEPGRHLLKVPIFQPRLPGATAVISKLTGTVPEYTNPLLLINTTSRAHTKTRSCGSYAEIQVFVAIA